MKIPSIPPHFLNENKKEVVFHIKGGFLQFFLRFIFTPSSSKYQHLFLTHLARSSSPNPDAFVQSKQAPSRSSISAFAFPRLLYKSESFELIFDALL